MIPAGRGSGLLTTSVLLAGDILGAAQQQDGRLKLGQPKTVEVVGDAGAPVFNRTTRTEADALGELPGLPLT